MSASDAPVVLVERDGDIAVVVLNRPHVLNALDAALRDAFIATMAALDADPEVRAVVITGAGERAFSAGQDLTVSEALDEEGIERWFRALHGFYQAVRAMGKPVVAALNGVATGAGFQVALWCDMRVAHPGVRMGQPEIDAGIASIVGSVVMREVMGLSRTVEIALTCRLVEAEEAKRLGLVNEVVPAAEVRPRALALARALAAQPPVAVRLTKRRVCEMTQAAYDAAIEAAVRCGREAVRSGEPRAAAEAFRARRRARSAEERGA